MRLRLIQDLPETTNFLSTVQRMFENFLSISHIIWVSHSRNAAIVNWCFKCDDMKVFTMPTLDYIISCGSNCCSLSKFLHYFRVFLLQKFKSNHLTKDPSSVLSHTYRAHTHPAVNFVSTVHLGCFCPFVMAQHSICICLCGISIAFMCYVKSISLNCIPNQLYYDNLQ